MQPAHHRSPIAGVVTGLTLLFLFFPLVVVVLFSFHETGSLSLPFTGFSFRWYEEVFTSPEVRDATTNSLIVAACVAVITLVLGTLAAYGLSRSESRLRGPLSLLFFLPLTLPGLFLGIALLSFLSRLDVGLSLTTVVIAHAVYTFPFFFLVARVALERLDPGIEEAAADLGASPRAAFRRATLPQVWPVLLGAAALAFMLSFDEFVITFFVIGNDATLPLYIFSQLRRTIDPTINVISTLLLAFMLLIWVVAFVLALRSERSRISPARATVEGQ